MLTMGFQSLCRYKRMSPSAQLTHSVCVVQFEAAEDLVDVSCVEKTIASNDHLETLWGVNKSASERIHNVHIHNTYLLLKET